MPIIVNRPPKRPVPPPHPVSTQPQVAVGDTVFATVFAILAGLLALGALGVGIWFLSPAVTQNAGMGAIAIPIVAGFLVIIFVAALVAAIKLTPMMLRGEASGFTWAGVACFALLASPVGAYALTSHVALLLAVGVVALGTLSFYRGARSQW